MFAEFPQLHYTHFDFENINTFENALTDIDSIFLLRPAHISDVETFFKPLISAIKKHGVKEVVFLSVQGAEKSKIIPHHKIENLIKNEGIDHIFLRPSYFMQNLTTTLLGDIQQKKEILLPAGKAVFNWIDAKNIGEAAAELLLRFADFKNRAIEITGYENDNFYTVAMLLSSVLPFKIKYQSTNPLYFFRIKKKEGLKTGLILVMILLHFIPRFHKEPEISTFYEELTGKKPTTLLQFLTREKARFISKDTSH